MREGTTHNFTHVYVLGHLGFDPQPEMFGYEPEYQVTKAIWEAFPREERVQACFKAPMELLHVRFESGRA